MHILCFRPFNVPVTYTQSLLKAYPQTKEIIGDRRCFRQEMDFRLFDVVLLTCPDRDLEQVARTWRMARMVRHNQPQCLIMIHRYPAGPIPPWFLSIPPVLYDFLFDDWLCASFLPLLATTLALRRKLLLSFHQAVPSLKGLIAIKSLLADTLGKNLSQHNIATTISEVDDDFETQFRHLLPDFVVLHCHNQHGDFEIVKKTTHTIRRIHPACILYLTCSQETLEEYTSRYRFHEYFYDELLTYPLGCHYLLTKLMHHMAGRYHHTPSQS